MVRYHATASTSSRRAARRIRTLRIYERSLTHEVFELAVHIFPVIELGAAVLDLAQRLLDLGLPGRCYLTRLCDGLFAHTELCPDERTLSRREPIELSLYPPDCVTHAPYRTGRRPIWQRHTGRSAVASTVPMRPPPVRLRPGSSSGVNLVIAGVT
jgi:hypothetical protein